MTKEIVSDGVSVQIIMPKTSSRLLHQAEEVVVKILDHKISPGMHPKVIQTNKDWLSYRVNRKYRLLVKRSCISTGPYHCMSHKEFDRWASKRWIKAPQRKKFPRYRVIWSK
ncbi:hypothetical protein [Salinivibrio sp. SS2]|uniref:ParE family toxin-like protein n=1 Tax=Salinivibrio sp. SS2 TaxID=1892894 RepID=UPI00084BFD94|nr:hypothetical protein [Salinivibrio sp. DV]ODQ00714.1 hypothetical protein BGK46_05620 [Salinivibrio sp. DV]